MKRIFLKKKYLDNYKKSVIIKSKLRLQQTLTKLKQGRFKTMENTIVIENVNNVEVVNLDGVNVSLENLLTAIHMNIAIFNSYDDAGKQNLLKCAIDTYKANLEKEKAVKKVKVQKSKHWDSKTTTEVKAIKAFIQGFAYLAGFVQNNANILNEYDNEGNNTNLLDIIDASIAKLVAENHSNYKKGSEKTKYDTADYEKASLFITALFKDKNSDLYKRLFESKFSKYERMEYTKKDKTAKQADSKQN